MTIYLSFVINNSKDFCILAKKMSIKGSHQLIDLLFPSVFENYENLNRIINNWLLAM